MSDSVVLVDVVYCRMPVRRAHVEYPRGRDERTSKKPECGTSMLPASYFMRSMPFFCFSRCFILRS